MIRGRENCKNGREKKYNGFKCNCPYFCQWASCHHGLLDAKPSGASTISRLGLHSRGKRGHPRHGDQGEDEGEESVGSRDRVQQTKGPSYTVPKTRAQPETVDSEDDAQLAPRASNKVLTCRAAYAVGD